MHIHCKIVAYDHDRHRHLKIIQNAAYPYPAHNARAGRVLGKHNQAYSLATITSMDRRRLYTSWVVELAGKPVGMVSAATTRTGIYLASAYVLPAYRQRGLSWLLMQQALTWARRSNKPLAYALTDIANKPAQCLFKKAGFRMMPNIKGRKLRMEIKL
jgi:GNAT superfamily N-acetyltransferase